MMGLYAHDRILYAHVRMSRCVSDLGGL